MLWFYLALLATLLYAIANLFDDNLLSFVYKSPYLSVTSVGFYATLPLFSRFFMHAHAISLPLAGLSLTAGFLNLAYYFFYFKGLESDSPSIVIALFGLAPAVLPFFAHVIVHEHLVGLDIVGFVVVLVASLGLAVTNLKRLQFSRALLFVLIAVVFMDIASIMTKYAYQKAGFYTPYLYFSAGMGLGGLCFFLLKFKENRQGLADIAISIKRLLPVFIVAEVIGLAAEFTLNLAISRGPVSLVKVIEGIQPMFVLLIALALHPAYPKYFREAEDGGVARKLAFMVLAIVGIALIGSTAKL